MEQDEVKALYVHILEECERQSFTIGEFNLLVRNLRSSANIVAFGIDKYGGSVKWIV